MHGTKKDYKACHLLVYEEKYLNIEDTVVCEALQDL